MNELDFKPARSVCLYAGRVILQRGDVDSAFTDIHGAEYGVMAGWMIDGEPLIDILTAIGITPQRFTKTAPNGRCLTHDLNTADLRLIKQDFTQRDDILEIQVAETGNGGLRIRVREECTNERNEPDSWIRETSYFGPYSVEWEIEQP